jgi:hypothetical protein
MGRFAEEMSQPAWLHLLKPLDRAWREGVLMMGNNPDSYIEMKLREAGVWPPANPNAKVPSISLAAVGRD